MTYDYGNARLRAMRSRLLSRQTYDELLAKSSIDEVITRLNETPYRDDVETALARFDGAECVFQAAHTNLTRTLRQIRAFYEDEARQLVDILLRRWDRHNVLTVLRGQAQRLSPDVVLAATVPVGELDETSLRELTRQAGLRAAIDLMITWRLLYADVLRDVQTRIGAAPDVDQLEHALNRAHYASILQGLDGGDRRRALLLEYVRTEIDIVNIGIALRLSQVPDLALIMRRRYGAEQVEALLIEPGGHLRTERLGHLVAEGSGIEGIVNGVADSRYGSALRAGWKRYRAGEGGVSVLERELERWLAEYNARMFTRDPLGIAVVIGYIGCKAVEVANVRLIAQAVALDLKREQIRRDLIFL